MLKIKIDNLYKSFGDKIIFNNFSTVFSSDRLNFIMSESGSGKTTLINILLGLLKADKGTICLIYEDKEQIVKDISSQKVAVVFQENRLCEDFSALSNIQLIQNPKNILLSTDILSSLGLSQCLHQKVSSLSGGQKRRLAIARALASDFDILILDEPFQGLDMDNKLNTVRCIKDFIADKLLIIITHDTKEVEMFSDSGDVSGVNLINIK